MKLAIARSTAAALIASALAPSAWGAAPAATPTDGDLIVVGAEVESASFSGVADSGELEFAGAHGRTLKAPCDRLVRWSTPAVAIGPDEVHLRDGSRLRLAAAWADAAPWSIELKTVQVRLHELGEHDIARLRLQAMLFRLPPDEVAQQRTIDDLLGRHAANPAADLVLLDNGDTIAGALVEAGGPLDYAALNADFGDVRIPLERIRGIAFSDDDPSDAAADSPADRRILSPKLLLGLRNGSRVAARSLAGGERLIVKTMSLGDVTIPPADVASIQARGAWHAYLSDIEAASYQHTPYLDLDWPHRNDRCVLGGPLRVQERTYLKGLGLHSASRLSFRLDGRFELFSAAVALDDAARGGGSVVCRVLTRRGDGPWQESFASPVLRSGDQPTPIAVDLNGADELALTVEYADRGDERDYVDWLDARLERTGPAGGP
ncbi:MAG: NPCBM/NEW2 domain-containing protein [Pirellulales bacterium]|nr:NPCBM/NEW2 domain-containing protein [Pirellulales bacterium]